MIKTIILSNKTIRYDLLKKKVKNINIRVKSDLTVHVSAPYQISQKEIERILTEKADFILSALQKYEQRQKLSASSSTDNSGASSITVFGRALPINVSQGKKNLAVINEDQIAVTLKDVNDSEAKKKAIASALDLLLREAIEEICRKVYPKFEKYLPCCPEIKFRRMKSRWGSCNYKKHILTFNYHLIHAPLDCVEYVIYHEFTHFIHPDHSKAFYLELSRHIPDHKNKKKRLQSVVIN